MAKRRKHMDPWSVIIIFCLVMIDIILWQGIINANVSQPPQKYVLDLGKNSSTLIIFPHNIKIMIDAGEDDGVVGKLDAALSSNNDNYIDLAIISSPQLGNYEGYFYILDHYSVGAFIYNGRNDFANTQEWAKFLTKVQSKKIPLITLGKGDVISYERNSIQIAAPSKDADRSADLNDTALTEVFR
jgi:beta-lactamase superfamily II metal-dependent hydrolase